MATKKKTAVKKTSNQEFVYCKLCNKKIYGATIGGVCINCLEKKSDQALKFGKKLVVYAPAVIDICKNVANKIKSKKQNAAENNDGQQ